MNRAKLEKKYVRTDLACESGTISPEDYKGALYERHEENGIVTERLSVYNECGERETGKKTGNYTTVSSPNFKNYYLKDESVKKILAKEVKSIAKTAIGAEVTSDTSVLVAGLGNRFITADSLGPRVADKINATRHVKDKVKVFDDIGCSKVSVIQTGVLGQTGIESSELISGAARSVSPDLVIAIDALAARSTSRLATTVQLTDSGIAPGGGIGNRRLAINKESVGFPVVSIGVPTVVDSATLIYDAVERAGIEEIDPLLEKILENSRHFFVSPNDSDLVIDYLSDVIAFAINDAFGTSEL